MVYIYKMDILSSNMDIKHHLQIIICILFGLIAYIIIAIGFVTYSFNKAFIGYNIQFDYLKKLITDANCVHCHKVKEDIEEEVKELEVVKKEVDKKEVIGVESK